MSLLMQLKQHVIKTAGFLVIQLTLAMNMIAEHLKGLYDRINI